MSYRPNVPQATDLIKNSQNDFLEDFQAINASLQTDHEPFGSANEGKHKVTRFPVQGSSPATSATEIALFSRVSQNPVGFGNVLCVREQNNGQINEFTGFLNAADGWTRLPNGNLFKWQTVSFGAGFTGLSAKTWTVAANIPVFTASPHFIMITPKENGANLLRVLSVVLSSISATNFNIWVETTRSGTQPAFDAYIFAIGNG